jgi:hypothetical protein
MKAGLMFGVLAVSAVAAGATAEERLRPDVAVLCAVAEVHQCWKDEPCERVSPASINLPTLYVIDKDAREVRALDIGSGDRVTVVEREEVVNDKRILQGAESGGPAAPEGVGWTVAINERTGDLVLSASGDEVGFVAFGKCAEAPR